MSRIFLSVDAESVGLLGGIWAIGTSLVDQQGRELEGRRWHVDHEQVDGDEAGRLWTRQNCAWAYATAPTNHTAAQMRQEFWAYWEDVQRRHNAIMLADHPFPVEARLLFECLQDDRRRFAPYPLLDCNSVVLPDAQGIAQDRLPCELPAHDPLADARQSARQYCEWLAGQVTT